MNVDHDNKDVLQVTGIDLCDFGNPRNPSPTPPPSHGNAAAVDNSTTPKNTLDVILKDHLSQTANIDNSVTIRFPSPPTTCSAAPLTGVPVAAFFQQAQSLLESDNAEKPPHLCSLFQEMQQQQQRQQNVDDDPYYYMMKRDEVARMTERSNSNFLESLCTKLAMDAVTIWSSGASSAVSLEEEQQRTACLCAVLRDERTQFAHKVFFYYNSGEEDDGEVRIPPSMLAKAHELHYQAVMTTEHEAHTEASLMSYLFKQQQQQQQQPEGGSVSASSDESPKCNYYNYSHLLGMGNSRLLCPEGNAILQLFLGCDFHSFLAAAATTTRKP